MKLPSGNPCIVYAQQAAYGLKESLVRAWKELERGAPLSGAAIYGESIVFLVNLCRAMQDESIPKPLQRPRAEEALLNRILVYVDANLQERITLADIGERFSSAKAISRISFRIRSGPAFTGM